MKKLSSFLVILLSAQLSMAKESAPAGVPTQLPPKKGEASASGAKPTPVANKVSKSTRKTKKRKVVADGEKPSDPRIPRTLPPFKGQKKVVLDFTKEAEQTPESAKVVHREALPINEAIKAQATSEAAAQAHLAKPAAPPQPMPTPTGQPSENLSTARVIVLPAPTPAPTATPAPTTATTRIESTAATTPPPQPQSTTVTQASAPSVTSAPSSTPSSSAGGHGTRFLLRGSYLGARYSRLESQLQDGATSLAVGISLTPDLMTSGLSDGLELRAVLEIGHGLDQKVTPQNTRSMLVRGEVGKAFVPFGPITPVVSGAIAYANVNVRSHRSRSENVIVMREHVKTSGLALIPSAALRITPTPLFSVDASIEYLSLVGATEGGALGGWVAGLTFSLPF